MARPRYGLAIFKRGQFVFYFSVILLVLIDAVAQRAIVSLQNTIAQTTGL